MLDVKQAVSKLERAGIIKNAEVFRRWLRDGKVAGAVIVTKQQGWQIPEESIEQLIVTKNKKSSKGTGYDDGFKAGYDKAQVERKAKMGELVAKGGYDKRFSLSRSEFRELAPIKIKSFLDFTDYRIFGWGVKRPRQEVVVAYLEGWFSFDNGVVVVFADDYEHEKELTLEYQAIQVLGEYLRQKFITTSR